MRKGDIDAIKIKTTRFWLQRNWQTGSNTTSILVNCKAKEHLKPLAYINDWDTLDMLVIKFHYYFLTFLM